MARYTEATIPEGITPKYQHNRHPGTGALESTVCRLYNGDKILTAAVAVVSPKERSPSKKIGRAVSLGRALKKLHLLFHETTPRVWRQRYYT